MEKALVSLALKTEDKVVESKELTSPQSSTAPQTPAAPLPTALKGVSQSLLERVHTLIILVLLNNSFAPPENQAVIFILICVACWCFRFGQRRLRSSRLQWPATPPRRAACWWCHGSRSWPEFCVTYLLQRRSRLSSWKWPVTGWLAATGLLWAQVGSKLDAVLPLTVWTGTFAFHIALNAICLSCISARR